MMRKLHMLCFLVEGDLDQAPDEFVHAVNEHLFRLVKRWLIFRMSHQLTCERKPCHRTDIDALEIWYVSGRDA
jgi:hypothetical protein